MGGGLPPIVSLKKKKKMRELSLIIYLYILFYTIKLLASQSIIIQIFTTV